MEHSTGDAHVGQSTIGSRMLHLGDQELWQPCWDQQDWAAGCLLQEGRPSRCDGIRRHGVYREHAAVRRGWPVALVATARYFAGLECMASGDGVRAYSQGSARQASRAASCAVAQPGRCGVAGAGRKVIELDHLDHVAGNKLSRRARV